MGASRGLGRSVVEEAVSTFACLDVVVKRLSASPNLSGLVSALRCAHIGDTLAWQRYYFSGTTLREGCGFLWVLPVTSIRIPTLSWPNECALISND
jgi:hypothetical protein